MKTLIAAVIALLLVCCNNNPQVKGESTDKKSGQSQPDASGSNIIEFKADGELVKAEGWVIQRFVWDEKAKAPMLNIVSDMHKEKHTINANLNGAVPGNYELGKGSLVDGSHATYFPDYFVVTDSYNFKTGSFNITEVDTVKGIVSGTFSGTATNSAGKTVVITEGKIINGKLKPGITNISKGFNQ